MLGGIESDDEIGVLSRSFDNTICRLRDYIGEISNLLEAIASGASYVGTYEQRCFSPRISADVLPAHDVHDAEGMRKRHECAGIPA